jgi:acylphosphatase
MVSPRTILLPQKIRQSENPAGQVSRRFVVSGHVQGVYFRASTRDQAVTLGLTGHARNLSSGDVEVLASGEMAAIAQLELWLHDGPREARVDKVLTEAIDIQGCEGFRIL